MRLAVKMALCMVALLGVLFAVCGYTMAQQSFLRAMEVNVQQNTMLHTQQKFQLRRSLAQGYRADGWDSFSVQDAGRQLAESAAAQQECCAVLTEGYAALYNSLPLSFGKAVQAAIVAADAGSYEFQRHGDLVYLTMSSPLICAGQQLWLLSAFDVSEIYLQRQAQLALFQKLYLGMMCAAALLCLLLSEIFTHPLHKLSTVSKRIAAGAYDQRVSLRRSDEIGEVSRNFDAMAEAVQEKVQSLELSVRQREDFMGAFTHELKTPMTAMMGYAALLKKDITTPEASEKALNYIHSETKRLETLSQKLLQLLELSDEGLKLKPVALDVVFACTKNALDYEGQTCVVELAPTHGVWVCADADLLVALLCNLIQNGMRAAPRDGCVRVSVKMQTDSKVTLTVSDTGRGIPPDQLSRIVEPFYSVDKSRSRAQNGSGLGLAISARIAQVHGTELRFSSTVGEGTSVSFALPVVAATQAATHIDAVLPQM